MPIFKCKMCGGTLDIQEGMTVCECEYCGSKQTIPSLDSEKKTNLFNRANRLRFNNEFDKAGGIYESIVTEFPEEAEAYWGLLLCKYGIEYVDDPATSKKIPTCHRANYTSIFDDENFEICLEYSDPQSKEIYRNEAKEIDRIQKSILDVASKEDPFDVFVCYKETDENGDRTKDSVLAQDIYDKLTEKGYKVFFSRITLEDKLGQEYEPYIFAALNSAKVMLAIGTKYEYYDAVWVKNEWSRFLDLMKTKKDKVLIPCYADIDAYDMPKEFKNLQGQDMNKLGFIQDLTRGIEKIISLSKESKMNMQMTTVTSSIPLIKRARLFLEEKNWEKALEYCEQALDANPENGEAYWTKELAERRCDNIDDLITFYYCNSAKESKSLSYARRFADQLTREKLDYFDNGLRNVVQIQQKRIEEKRLARANNYSLQKIKKEIEQSRNQMKLLEDRVIVGSYITLAVTIEGNVVATRVTDDNYGNYDSGYTQATKWTDISKIYETFGSIIGLKNDGSLLFTKNPSVYASSYTLKEKMSEWREIIQLYHGCLGWYGLTRAGTVLFARDDEEENDKYQHGQDYVSELKDVKQILCECEGRLICIKNDNTLCATKFTNGKDMIPWDEMSTWKDIHDVCFDVPGRIVGIKTDGTLVATRFVDYDGELREEDDKWSEISSWTDVVKICNLADCRIIAIDAYGEILVSSKFLPYDEQDEEIYDPLEKVASWNGLIDFYAPYYDYAFGLRHDGTLLSAKWFKEHGEEDNDKGQADARGISNVAKCIVKWERTVCVKRDGSVIAIGDDYGHGANNVSSFNLFDSIETLEEIITKNEEKARKEEERQKKIDAYEMYLSKINAQIEAEIMQAVEPIKTKYSVLKQPILSEMNQFISLNSQKKKELEENRINLENRRTSLGIFKGKEKAAIASQISDIDAQLESLETEQVISDRYEMKLIEIDNQEKTEIKRISKEIKSKYDVVKIDEF